MKTNTIHQSLLDSTKHVSEMRSAIDSGRFYVVAIPCLSGYSIGCIDDNAPALFASLDEANKENQDMIDEINDQIKDGERDEGDEWEGVVLSAVWDCKSDSIELYEGDELVSDGCWREMSGL